MGDTTDKAGQIQINLRVSPELAGIIDRLVAQASGERPGTSISRSDVIRDAIYAAAKAKLNDRPAKKGTKGEAP